MVSRRQERVSEMLREELSLLIGTELTDPRLEDAMINVTDVEVSQDLRSARVYVMHVLGPEASRHVLAALAHAEGYLRRALLQNLSLRFVPELFFQIDTTEERARHVDELLDSLAGHAPAPNQDDHADVSNSDGDGPERVVE